MRTPVQVDLDQDDLARLEAFARERGWTRSQVIRTAVGALTRPPAVDPLLELSGDIDGLPPDLSHEFHRHLNDDSSAWIALRSLRDQHHTDADRSFRAAIERRIPLVTTNLILAEMHRLTLFRAGFEAAQRAFDRIDASPSVTTQFATAEDHESARRWIERLAPRPVTYTDAVSFAVTERTACSHVLSFEEDFAAAGFEVWRVR